MMTPDSDFFVKRIRYLSRALIVSGALNIAILSFFLYWILRERPPTPYCELKPVSFEQQQLSLADCKECHQVLLQFSTLSFLQLVDRLSNTNLVENGYCERDLALACLMSFYHFDMERALPTQLQPRQKRLLSWKRNNEAESVILSVYPDLNQTHFHYLIDFATKEKWPFTAKGLFAQLQKLREENNLDPTLSETFFRTQEFWTVELLFKRAGREISREEILALLLEGEWELLNHFAVQQRKLNDQSEARRQKFLIEYISHGSSAAANLLLKTDWEFACKKLDDTQVIAILEVLQNYQPEAVRYAKNMLTSPRGLAVWQKSSQFLYRNAGEKMPPNWNYQAVLDRFIAEKGPATAFTVSKPLVAKAPIVEKSQLSKNSFNTLSKPVSPYNKKPIFQTYSEKSILQNHSSNPKLHVVQEGESLWKIAQQYGLSVNRIKESNQLKSDIIKPGSVLKIPVL